MHGHSQRLGPAAHSGSPRAERGAHRPATLPPVSVTAISVGQRRPAIALPRRWLRGPTSPRSNRRRRAYGLHLSARLLQRTVELDATFTDLELGYTEGAVVALAQRDPAARAHVEIDHFRHASRPGLWQLVIGAPSLSTTHSPVTTKELRRPDTIDSRIQRSWSGAAKESNLPSRGCPGLPTLKNAPGRTNARRWPVFRKRSVVRSPNRGYTGFGRRRASTLCPDHCDHGHEQASRGARARRRLAWNELSPFPDAI